MDYSNTRAGVTQLRMIEGGADDETQVIHMRRET